MAVVQFAAGDKDYIDKLNQMSQQAGDTAQFKADTQQLKIDTQAILDQTNTVKTQTEALREETRVLRDQTAAITVGDLLFVETPASKEVSHGDLILATTAGIELALNTFKANIQVGQWFTVENASNGLVYIASLAGLSLVGDKLTVSNGERFAVSPGRSFTFRVISASELRIK